MTPQSLLSQIFESHDPDFDQVDDFLFVIYNPTYKGRTYSFANLDYTRGIVEFGVKPLQGVNEHEEILERFALKITLESI